MDNQELLNRFEQEIYHQLDKDGRSNIEKLCNSYNLCREGKTLLRNYGLRIEWANKNLYEDITKGMDSRSYMVKGLITTIPFSFAASSAFSIAEYLLTGETDFLHNLKHTTLFGIIFESFVGPFNNIYKNLHKNAIAEPYIQEVFSLKEYTEKKLEILLKES